MDKKEIFTADNRKTDKDIDKEIIELLGMLTTEQLVKALEIVLAVSDSE